MAKFFEIGSLIKSNPISNFWVCSVVLTYQPKTNDFNALSHIGVTNAVFTHDFTISDVDIDTLKIIDKTNRDNLLVPCISVYSAKMAKDVEVIDIINISTFVDRSLAFEIGNGSDGGWPFSGKVSKSIGSESVHLWRAEHDKEAWLADIKAAEKSHREMLDRLK